MKIVYFPACGGKINNAHYYLCRFFGGGMEFYMLEFELIGYPLGHSISPQIQKKLFELNNIQANYKLHLIEPENFENEINNLKKLNGFNVTIPYKQKIIRYLDDISPKAKNYAAVNTVKCENGKLAGFNTDVTGFLKSLEQAEIKLEGKVLLCGTGGVSSMLAVEALEHGCELTVAARTAEKALAFTAALLRKYPHAIIIPEKLDSLNYGYDLIINGTPAGMYPNIDECPVTISVIKNSKAVFDTIYNPQETLLLKQARNYGVKTQGGLPMLVWQAAAAQEIWTGCIFKTEDIIALCGELYNIFEM